LKPQHPVDPAIGAKGNSGWFLKFRGGCFISLSQFRVHSFPQSDFGLARLP